MGIGENEKKNLTKKEQLEVEIHYGILSPIICNFFFLREW